jgi:type II secretory pathway pseudopilin PulG
MPENLILIIIIIIIMMKLFPNLVKELNSNMSQKRRLKINQYNIMR